MAVGGELNVDAIEKRVVSGHITGIVGSALCVKRVAGAGSNIVLAASLELLLDVN